MSAQRELNPENKPALGSAFNYAEPSGAANWTRDDLVIDREYEIDCDVGEWILVSIETRFDVDAKFGIKSLPDGESWVNLYARYNPITGELLMEYVINTDDTQKACDYEPNEADTALVIELITAMISEEEDCSPLELIELRSIEEKIEGDIKMPKITKEKIKIDPEFDLNPLVPGDIIVYAEIEMDEPKGTKWLEQFGFNVLSGAFYVRYGMSDKSAEEPGFDLSEDDRALIIEAISEMVQKETGLSPREYYDKNVAEKEKNLEIMKAVISTSLHLTYRDETAPNLTALYKQARSV